MKNYAIEIDANKLSSGFAPQSDTIYNIVLVANVMQSITIPAGATLVEFKATGNFYCKFDSNVAIPVTNIIDGSGGELNPDKRVIRGNTTIRLISGSSIVVTLAFYNVPRPPFIVSGSPYTG